MVDILLLVLRSIGYMTGLGLLGFVLFRWRLAPLWLHGLMSKTVLYFTLPALLIAKLAQATGLLASYPGWYWLPVSAALLYGMGGAVGALAARLIPDRGRDRTLCALMCAFHNAAYLPLVMVRGVFPEYENLDVLVMIYVIGASPLLWTVCPAILAGGRQGKRFHFGSMFNPPTASVLIGFLAMMTHAGEWLDAVPVGGLTLRFYTLVPLGLVGELSIPLILLVLGGTLAQLPSARPENPRFLAVTALAKLVFLPVVGLLVLPRLPLPLEIVIVMVIGSMAPTALNMTVQAREYADKATEKRVGEGLFWIYLAAIPTLTVFLFVWRLMVEAMVRA